MLFDLKNNILVSYSINRWPVLLTLDGKRRHLKCYNLAKSRGTMNKKKLEQQMRKMIYKSMHACSIEL